VLQRAGQSLLLLLACGSWAVQAQQVRLSQLLELAKTRHPSILQARSQEQSAGFDLDAAKWGRYPSVYADARSDSAYAQSTARVEQPIWAGGRIDGRIELGEANLRSAVASVRDAELNALTQVGSSFFEWLRLNARLQSAEQNVLEHKRLAQLIGRRVGSEISPPADSTLAQARLQQAITERLQIERQLENTYNTLVQWAGPLPGQPVAPANIVYIRAPISQAVVDKAFQTSGQRQKLIAQIESADAQIRLAKAQGLPSVVAGYQYITSGPLFNAPNRGRGYLGLQFQPGAGLSALAGIQSAAAKKQAAEQELQLLERNLEFQARTLYSDIDALQAQLPPAQELVQGTSELVESYLRQYQIGRKNWLDVLNAQREKTQADYNLADVRFGLRQAQTKLLLLTGELNSAQNSVILE
jgi:adhesin transport system outer membrane protein